MSSRPYQLAVECERELSRLWEQRELQWVVNDYGNDHAPAGDRLPGARRDVCASPARRPRGRRELREQIPAPRGLHQPSQLPSPTRKQHPGGVRRRQGEADLAGESRRKEDRIRDVQASRCRRRAVGAVRSFVEFTVCWPSFQRSGRRLQFPRWTVENRQFVDSANPAISSAAETSEFYFVPSSGRKSVCSFVRQLRGPHFSTCA